jgi:ATP-dependent Clp protease ATP-binding subunit ClpB
VRRKPYSVVLLDEVEKAHPDVFNILLQVLDDGRLTDSQGRTVDFKNTVIIMTSNLGSDLIQEHYREYSYGQMKDMLMSVLSKQFRPEFLNRLDETVVFHPLDNVQIRSIAKIQLARLEQRLAERQYRFSITEAALDKLAEIGFDPLYGARPLKRAIQQHLENPLAQALLQGDVAPGSTILLDHNGAQFIVSSKV